MTISAFDLFKVGIGPSSSHTVGPMRAACSFALRLQEEGLLTRVARVRCELFGSLGATGHGHGSVKAVVLGLEGERPELVDPSTAGPRVESIRQRGQAVAGRRAPDRVLRGRRRRPAPPQAARLPQQRDALPGAGRRGGRAGPARVLLRGRRLRARRGRSRQPGDRRGQHSRPLPVPHRRGAAGARAGVRAADQRHHARQRALLAQRAGGPRGSAAHLGGDAGVRRARDPHPRRAPRRPQGPQARRRAPRPARGPPRRHRPAAGDGVGDPLRAGGERGERRGWPRGHGADQRRRRDRAGRPALLPRLRRLLLRRRRGAVPADRRRDRAAVQGERLHLRSRGRLPGRGGLGLLHGRRRPRRGHRRHARAGGERRRDRHRAQPRAHLRPRRRAGADPVHRAQRRRVDQGHHRRADGRARRRPPPRLRWTRPSRPCGRPAPT